MFKKIHNEETKKFFQKLLLFIDSTINQAVGSDANESQKIITTGLSNIKDAILSEIVRDNFIDAFNETATNNQKKKEEKDIIGQEKASEKDQLA